MKPVRHLFWLLPVLAGSAAYLHGRQAVSVGGTPPPDPRLSRTEDRPPPYHGDPAALFAETLRAHPEPKSSTGKSVLLTAAARRARLLEIHGQATDHPSYRNQEDEEMETLARGIGRDEGAGGLAWMDGHRPGLRRFAMDGWADSDPAAAFESLVSGDRVNPALHVTVMKLLQAKAADGPEALRQAASRVSWHLFPLNDDSFLTGEEPKVFPLQGDAKAWIDSGVAASLAEQGVQISGLYKSWAAQDSGAALQAWSTWPSAAGWRDSQQFMDLLMGAVQSEEGGSRLQQIIATADPAMRERLMPVAKSINESTPPLQGYRDLFPSLFPAPPSEPASHGHP